MAQNDAVKFVFIPVGKPIPEQKNEGTIYFCAEGQKIYVGNNLIANAGGGGGGDIDIEINGEGDYIASAGFSNNVLTLTKSSLYDAVDNAGFASEEYVDDAISNAGFATESYVDEAISSAIPGSFVLEVDTSAPSGQYLYDIQGSSNPLTLDGLYQSFGSIASGDEALVTGGIVYSAISGLASEGYVQSAISSIYNTLNSHYITSSYLESYVNDYNDYITGDSSPLYNFINSFLAEESGPLSYYVTQSYVATNYATQSYVASAIEHLLSWSDITTSTYGDYLIKANINASDGMSLTYGYFGSIGQYVSSPVTGSTIYSAISNVMSIPPHPEIDGDYLLRCHVASGTTIISYEWVLAQ